MKRVFFLLLTAISFAACAQTAGNDNFKFQFVTYAQRHIVLSVHSLVADGCKLETRWQWNGQDTTIYFTGPEIRQIMLPSPGGNVTVRAKTVTACNNGVNGPWITMALATLAISDVPKLAPPKKEPAPVHFRVFSMDGKFQFEMDGTRPQLISRLNRWHRGVWVVFDGMNSQMIANF